MRALLDLKHDTLLLRVEDLQPNRRKTAKVLTPCLALLPPTSLVKLQPLDPSDEKTVRADGSPQVSQASKAQDVRSFPLLIGGSGLEA